MSKGLMVEDKLDHSRVAKRLAQDVNLLNDARCIALFGSWGRGKTDVLNRLKIELEMAQIHTVSANPWSSGHQSILMAIGSALASHQTIDESTRKIFAKLGRASFMIANRFAMKKVVDLEELADDLLDLSRETDHPQTPTQMAALHIDELVEKCFKGKKVVVLIDDIDRCPPSWQRSILESLYFLKICRSSIIFICALDQRSLLHRVGPECDLDEVGSLCTKVFDIVHELHPASEDLIRFGVELMNRNDEVLRESISTKFGKISQMWDKDNSPAAIMRGVCSHTELATPRTVLRCLTKLRTIAFSVEDKLNMQLNEISIASGFGFALALRDRFPILTEFVFEELPDLLISTRSSHLEETEGAKRLFERIASLNKIQAEVTTQSLRNLGLKFGPTQLPHHSQARMVASGIAHAAQLCRIAIV
jgi:hypothetical protein